MKIFYLVALATVLTGAIGCNKKNDYSTGSTREVAREWSIQVSSENENHLTTNDKPATGTFEMKLYSDSSITFQVYIQDYYERIQKVTFNSGDAISDDGPEIFDLKPRVSGGLITGDIKLSAAAYTSLKNNEPMYINFITGNNPKGLLRGQVDTKLVYSQRVALSGNNIVPSPVTTTTNGTAYLRLAENKMLYSKVDIVNNDPLDYVTSASVFTGVAGTNGSFLISLAASSVEFNKPLPGRLLNDAQYESLLKSSAYVIVTSSDPSHAAGKIRGQIR